MWLCDSGQLLPLRPPTDKMKVKKLPAPRVVVKAGDESSLLLSGKKIAVWELRAVVHPTCVKEHKKKAIQGLGTFLPVC